jgi:hypothetical protein
MAKVTNTGVHIVEGSAAAADTGGEGQIWVKSDVPSSLYYTDDAGTDFRMGGITLGTEAAHGGGASRTLTDIPVGVKRVIVMIEQLSTGGTSNIILRIGPSGGVVTSGYDCDTSSISADTANQTDGFALVRTTVNASLYNGVYHLDLFNASTNQWFFSGGATTNNDGFLGYGHVSLGGALNKLTITTTGGSDVFDSGNVNISFQ